MGERPANVAAIAAADYNDKWLPHLQSSLGKLTIGGGRTSFGEETSTAG
jgi:hypothetical protein